MARMPEYAQRLEWSAGQLRAERERRLCALVKAAQERSPWHRERLGGIDAQSLREEDLESLPTMTKDDLMANWDAVVTDRRLSLEMVEEHIEGLTGDAYLLDEFHAVASSGSTGRRGVFVYDWEGWLTVGVGSLRRAFKAGVRQSPGGPMVGAAVAAERAYHITSAAVQTFTNPALTVHRVPVTLPIDEIVARLNEIEPQSLTGYASMLHLLAERAKAGDLRIRPLRIISTAEPLLPEARRAIEEVWGVPVLNGYGSSEAGLAGCCELARLHVWDDLIYFEPVDRFGKPVAPGVTADKVLLTNLYNLALPLIRYELTDQVTVLAESCACGSAQRLLADVQGRLDDVFTYGGVRVHPHVFRSVLAGHQAITAYQVRQTERGAEVDLLLIGELELDRLWNELRAALEKVGLHEPEVAVRPVAGFERGATGKLKRFVPLARAPAAG